jgi:hypothetical protein
MRCAWVEPGSGWPQPGSSARLARSVISNTPHVCVQEQARRRPLGQARRGREGAPLHPVSDLRESGLFPSRGARHTYRATGQVWRGSSEVVFYRDGWNSSFRIYSIFTDTIARLLELVLYLHVDFTRPTASLPDVFLLDLFFSLWPGIHVKANSCIFSCFLLK